MRTPGQPEHIEIVYPDDFPNRPRTANRLANLILLAVAAVFLGLTAAFIAGVWA